MYKVSFYVPESHLENVKNALFAKGAGKIGYYDCCAWQTLGTGQFRPLPGSNPTIGSAHEVSTVSEYKVEMICENHLLSSVLTELVRVHPYEAPAYEAYKVTLLEEI